MSAHSKFSPSAAARWLACPASIRLSEDIEDSAGPAAVLGTEIHAQAEAMLTDAPEPHPEHRDIALEFVDAVRALVWPRDTLLVEQLLWFDDYAPDGFGTADVVILPGSES